MEGRAFPSTSPTLYDKDFPFFRQPTILGSFSIDGKTPFVYISQSSTILQYWSQKTGIFVLWPRLIRRSANFLRSLNLIYVAQQVLFSVVDQDPGPGAF
jgi:hypothetical protein